MQERERGISIVPTCNLSERDLARGFALYAAFDPNSNPMAKGITNDSSILNDSL
jgi:hypothetical protein